MKSLFLKSHAKINLFLHITNFSNTHNLHLIESVFTKLLLHDEIWMHPAKDIKVSVQGNFTVSGNNIVELAIRKLLQYIGCAESIGAHIIIKKNIPVAAGLGGGSSNAATAMLGILKLYKNTNKCIAKISINEVIEFASQIGSDVPFFCMQEDKVFVSSTGSALKALPKNHLKYPILIINPNKKLQTKNIFMHYKKNNLTFSSEVSPNVIADDDSLLHNTKNDLQASAISICPEIQDILDEINSQKKGLIMSRMSGSGATCFGLFKDLESRDLAFYNIKKNRQDWIVYKDSITL